MLLRAYSLFGLRRNAHFLLWQVAEILTRLTRWQKVFSTGMGVYLQNTYSMLAMTRKSI